MGQRPSLCIFKPYRVFAVDADTVQASVREVGHDCLAAQVDEFQTIEVDCKYEVVGIGPEALVSDWEERAAVQRIVLDWRQVPNLGLDFSFACAEFLQQKKSMEEKLTCQVLLTNHVSRPQGNWSMCLDFGFASILRFVANNRDWSPVIIKNGLFAVTPTDFCGSRPNVWLFTDLHAGDAGQHVDAFAHQTKRCGFVVGQPVSFPLTFGVAQLISERTGLGRRSNASFCARAKFAWPRKRPLLSTHAFVWS